MKAIKIDTKGNISPLETLTLEEFQKAVGGYIEPIYLRLKPYEHEGNNYDVMLVNEEGLPLNLPFNTIGRQIYAENTRPNNNPIVGDIVLTTQKVLNRA